MIIYYIRCAPLIYHSELQMRKCSFVLLLVTRYFISSYYKLSVFLLVPMICHIYLQQSKCVPNLRVQLKHSIESQKPVLHTFFFFSGVGCFFLLSKSKPNLLINYELRRKTAKIPKSHNQMLQSSFLFYSSRPASCRNLSSCLCISKRSCFGRDYLSPKLTPLSSIWA